MQGVIYFLACVGAIGIIVGVFAGIFSVKEFMDDTQFWVDDLKNRVKKLEDKEN